MDAAPAAGTGNEALVYAMRLKTLLALVVPVAFSVLFVRLGMWQLDRHDERAARNVGLTDRLAMTATPVQAVWGDTGDARWLPVEAKGRFLYDLEQVHASRTNNGSPGVHLLTPMALEGTDTVLIVARGWVYSPDASTVDLDRWREADSVSLRGHLLPLTDSGPAPPSERSAPIRILSRRALQSRIPRPLAPVLLVMTSDSAARADSVPRRLEPPVLDNGPHRSYAIQWFSFALIALVGGIVLFRRAVVSNRADG